MTPQATHSSHERHAICDTAASLHDHVGELGRLDLGAVAPLDEVDDGSSSLLPVPSVPRPAPAAAVPGLPREQPRSLEIASDWMTLAHILKGVEAPGYLGAPEPPPGGGLGRGRCRGRPRDALVGLGEGKAEELPEGKRADSSNPTLVPCPHIQTRPAPSSS